MLSLSLCLSLFCSLCIFLSSLHRTKGIVINGLNDWTFRIQIWCNFLQSIGNLTMPPLSLCLYLFCSLCLSIFPSQNKSYCYKWVKWLDHQDTDLLQFFAIYRYSYNALSLSLSLSFLLSLSPPLPTYQKTYYFIKWFNYW